MSFTQFFLLLMRFFSISGPKSLKKFPLHYYFELGWALILQIIILSHASYIFTEYKEILVFQQRFWKQPHGANISVCIILDTMGSTNSLTGGRF